MSTVAIIQARYSSTRLPGKCLMDLHGKPVIQHVIERANRIPGVDNVVLAIAPGEAEAPLRDWAIKHAPCAVWWTDSGLPVHDVLTRFMRVLEMFPEADTVLRLTGDCPLLDPMVCGRVLERLRKTEGYYVWVDTHSGAWPDGLDVEAMRRSVLDDADRFAKGSDREHVTSFIRREAEGYVDALPPDRDYSGWPKLSIDTEDDMLRVKRWIAK